MLEILVENDSFIYHAVCMVHHQSIITAVRKLRREDFSYNSWVGNFLDRQARLTNTLVGLNDICHF